jgi:hypothetical protein
MIVIKLNPEGKIAGSYAQELATLLGFFPKELYGRKFMQLIVPADRSRFNEGEFDKTALTLRSHKTPSGLPATFSGTALEFVITFPGETVEEDITPPGESADLTVDELKEQLRALGLPVSGKKSELIERLKEHAENGSSTTEA